MNLSKKLNRDINLKEKQQIKQEKTIQKTSEIKYLNRKLYCSRPTGTARLRKPARGLLSVPAWALGPVAKNRPAA
jgi:hypothetical protein